MLCYYCYCARIVLFVVDVLFCVVWTKARTCYSTFLFVCFLLLRVVLLTLELQLLFFGATRNSSINKNVFDKNVVAFFQNISSVVFLFVFMQKITHRSNCIHFVFLPVVIFGVGCVSSLSSGASVVFLVSVGYFVSVVSVGDVLIDVLNTPLDWHNSLNIANKIYYIFIANKILAISIVAKIK